MAICRLCSYPHLSQVLELKHSPTNISRLLRSNELDRDRSIDLQVFRCEACGFVQLTETLGDDFYDDYVMTARHSAQMRIFQEQQARDFVQQFGLSGKRIIEVGCGDGNFLGYLKSAGALAQGIEPSAVYREHARKAGHTPIAGYVGAENPVPEGPYEAFVTRQVFEHVPDPNDFLLGIRASLTTNAVGLVEVPSLEQAIEGARFYDFFADHLNYFSERTLRFALEKNGFDVIDVSRGMNGEYNVALVSMAQDQDLSGIQRSIDLLSEDIRAFLQDKAVNRKRVAVWGSGGKGLSSMAVADMRGIEYVVDSDSNKHGLFTPVTHYPIVPPSQLLEDPVDAIIVTALAYTDEILTQLRDEVAFGGEIAILGPRLQIL